MRETIKIGKTTWIVTEPDRSIISEKKARGLKKTSALDLLLMRLVDMFCDWLAKIKITWPEHFNIQWHRPVPEHRPQIEFGDGWQVALHVIGGVLQAILIVLGSVARVIAASMASSICW